MATKPPEPGTVVAVPLDENRFGIGRVLVDVTEFYDKTIDDPHGVSAQDAAGGPVAFAVCVMNRDIRSRRWPTLGVVPLSEEERGRRTRFAKQDPISKRLSVYWEDPDTGEVHEEPATPADLTGLETAAVWSAGHVEDRLRDHFAGRENKWVRSIRPTIEDSP